MSWKKIEDASSYIDWPGEQGFQAMEYSLVLVPLPGTDG
jgi:hypothetical protein